MKIRGVRTVAVEYRLSQLVFDITHMMATKRVRGAVQWFSGAR